MKASATFRNEEKAPASEGGRYKGNEKKKAPNWSSGPFLILSRRRPTFPHSCPCSIIGPARLNFRVRDGNGCDPRGITTGNSKLANGFQSSSRAKDRECDNRMCGRKYGRQNPRPQVRPAELGWHYKFDFRSNNTVQKRRN